MILNAFLCCCRGRFDERLRIGITEDGVMFVISVRRKCGRGIVVLLMHLRGSDVDRGFVRGAAPPVVRAVIVGVSELGVYCSVTPALM